MGTARSPDCPDHVRREILCNDLGATGHVLADRSYQRIEHGFLGVDSADPGDNRRDVPVNDRCRNPELLPGPRIRDTKTDLPSGKSTFVCRKADAPAVASPSPDHGTKTSFVGLERGRSSSSAKRAPTSAPPQVHPGACREPCGLRHLSTQADSAALPRRRITCRPPRKPPATARPDPGSRSLWDRTPRGQTRRRPTAGIARDAGAKDRRSPRGTRHTRAGPPTFSGGHRRASATHRG